MLICYKKIGEMHERKNLFNPSKQFFYILLKKLCSETGVFIVDGCSSVVVYLLRRLLYKSIISCFNFNIYYTYTQIYLVGYCFCKYVFDC